MSYPVAARMKAVLGAEQVIACPAITPSLGLEKLTNPDLEPAFSSGLANGWTKNGSPTLAEEDSIKNTQTSSQKITGAAANDGVYQYKQASLTANNWVLMSAYAYLASGAMKMQLNLNNDSLAATSISPANQWNPYIRTGRFISGNTGPFLKQNGSGTSVGYLDTCSLKVITFASMRTWLATRTKRGGQYGCNPILTINTQGGLLLSYQDDNNFVMAMIDRTSPVTVYLISVIGGSWSIATSGAVAYSDSKSLSVWVNADEQTYTLFYDGALVGVSQVISPATLGLGVYGWSAYAANSIGTVWVL